MKGLLVLTSLLLLLVGCGNEKSYTPDHKDVIDSNTARIELLEAQDNLQDLRMDSIEVMISNLDIRVTKNEEDIDINEADILTLFGLINDLDQDLIDLRNDLESEVLRLERADRRTRRIIRRRVSSLRRRLAREIRVRRLADINLQNQIDDLESDLSLFEARQSFFNFIIAGALAGTNLRITLLQQNIQTQINSLDSRVTVNEGDITDIQTDVSNLQNQVVNLQTQIDNLESEVVSVVYPCGTGNSDEVLLDTQDGLLAYFQTTKNQTVTFSDTVTIGGQSLPGYMDKFCVDRRKEKGPGTQMCREYDERFVSGSTSPVETFNVGDTSSFKVIDNAYLAVLEDGNYRTTDGFSCNFTISNGEVQ